MKKPLTSTATISSLVLLFLVSPKSEAKIYSLNEALKQLEQSSPIVMASQAQLENIQEQASLQKRAAFLPKIGAQAEVKRIHSNLTQTNGFGTFDYAKQNQVTGGIELTQPIFNLASMGGEREKLAQLQKADELRHKSQTQKAKLELISHFINYQKTKISIDSLLRLEKSLTGIEREVQKFYKLGLRGESDLLTVQIALSDNRAEQIKVTSLQDSLKKYIQIHLPDFEDVGVIELEGLHEKQFQKRSDILALENLVEAERIGLKAIRQGYLPTLDFKARQVYADQALLDQKNWTETSLVLTWALFEGGTRSARSSAQAAEIRKLEKQLQATQSLADAEKINNAGLLKENDFRSSEAIKNLERAKKALAEDQRNSKAGKVPLKDWLSSEIRFEQKKLELEALKLDKIKLQYDDLYVNGDLI